MEKNLKKIWKNKYQIIEHIGTGGYGRVYQVWDLHLEKIWAMKILEEKISVLHDYGKEEIMDELTALKKISHPNFPRIVDAFEEDGRCILIMDYIHGITLEAMIEKGPMKEEEMHMILSQICDAMLYLHQSNPPLLYLDLKPSNIMMEENKTVKLVDLGSISIKGKRGKICGSFGYASPEQVKVQKEGIFLTEQSDIFSFGMIMYAMATGNSSRLPIIEVKNRHGIFIRRENPFLSISLEKIMEKCTRGSYTRRYCSMREVKNELEIWKKKIKKKGNIDFCLWRIPRMRRKNRKQWYQEKSIFCTEGKHSFYIAKKIMVLFLCILCLSPEKMILAGESKKDSYKKEEGIIEDNYEELNVIIRDYKLRKILVKNECAYETGGSIFLEIPWDEIEGKTCNIRVECQDEGKKVKHFFLQCTHKED